MLWEAWRYAVSKFSRAGFEIESTRSTESVKLMKQGQTLDISCMRIRRPKTIVFWFGLKHLVSGMEYN